MLLFLESTNPLKKKSHKNNSMNMISGTSAGLFFFFSIQLFKQQRKEEWPIANSSQILRLTLARKNLY